MIYLFLPYNYQWKIAQWPLEVGEHIPPDFGDVIIVPGSGCHPGRGTEERLNVASKLFRQKPRWVILSEGTCTPNQRAGFIKRVQEEWRIDTSMFIWDTTSFNSVENIAQSKKIADSLGLKDAIVCTSQFHQLRCKIIMSKLWKEEFKMAYMPDSMLEMEKEAVYVQKRGKTIKQEYLKILHHLIFL
jgi:uncharacterized SAM-binding protein YcdF (DUF218 family)